MDIKQTILDAFKSGKLERKTQNEIISSLRLSPSHKKIAKSVIKQLCQDGQIIKVDGGRYVSPQRAGAFYATVKANAQGYGFLIPDGRVERENDYFVPAKKLHGALDRDRVLAIPSGHGDEAVVIKILSRGRQSVTGRLTKQGKSYFVIPDDRAYRAEVVIPHSLLNGAVIGDKVVAEITGHTSGSVNGKISTILGRDGELNTEEEAIIASAELNTVFPEYVVETAEKVAAERVVLGNRRDLRNLLTITIDGADTRDIDDAVSLERVGDKYRLGVHIADVSHYVKPNGCIDKEAYDRGTSVYFPDRVLPMLPKALSNGACSLNEGEDRYAMTCFMLFDFGGKKVDFELCESVIRSDRRMTYDEVTKVLERGKEAESEYGEIVQMLEDMQRLCLKLEERRQGNGEVALEVKEAHIYLNERGEIVIPDYQRAVSHRMIEQFMVAANETVARFAEERKAPFLYRIHEQPSAEKANLLYGFVKDLGITVKGNPEEATPRDYQRILKATEGKPFFPVVNKVMLRSMQKARYCRQNLKHFGLASECYCHFTSPIRRYPDLFVHRVLKLLLKGGDDEIFARFARFTVNAEIDTSERERRAELAERDVDDLYKTAYMQERLGEQFDGVISGVTESGIFVELTNAIEGYVRFEYLPADRYELYPEKFLLKGVKHSYRLGDSVRVKATYCDLPTRRIHFELI